MIIFSEYIKDSEKYLLNNNRINELEFIGEGMDKRVYKLNESIVCKVPKGHLKAKTKYLKEEFEKLKKFYSLDLNVPRPLAYDSSLNILYVENIKGVSLKNYLLSIKIEDNLNLREEEKLKFKLLIDNVLIQINKFKDGLVTPVDLHGDNIIVDSNGDFFFVDVDSFIENKNHSNVIEGLFFIYDYLDDVYESSAERLSSYDFNNNIFYENDLYDYLHKTKIEGYNKYQLVEDFINT